MKLIYAACLLTLTFATAACDRAADDQRDDIGTAEPGTAGTSGTSADGSVRVADLTARPDEYAGRTVTVVADVEEVFGPRAFALDEDAPLAGGIDNDLLVLSKEAGSLAPIDDQWMNNKVRVTGTVGRMAVVEIERELGWDLDPQLEVELERADAVLIASSVERVAADQARTDANTDATVGTSGAQPVAPFGAQPIGASGAQEQDQPLPDTASPLALAGLLGLLCMGGAAGLRMLGR